LGAVVDAVQYPAIFLVCAVLGWLAGRVTSQFHRDTEAVDRALGLDGDSFTDSHAFPVSVNNGAGWYLAKRRDARRRTILRDYSGVGAGRHAAGGDSDSSDAAAVK
jgi:hypothetical protein